MALTIREFSGLDAKEPYYRSVCKQLDLPPVPNGYGVLHVTDDDGKHFSLFTTDLKWFRRFTKSGHHIEATTYDGTPRPGRQLDEVPTPEEFAERFRIIRAGWPDEWELLYAPQSGN